MFLVLLESDDPTLTHEYPFALAHYLYKDCYISGGRAASFLVADNFMADRFKTRGGKT